MRNQERGLMECSEQQRERVSLISSALQSFHLDGDYLRCRRFNLKLKGEGRVCCHCKGLCGRKNWHPLKGPIHLGRTRKSQTSKPHTPRKQSYLRSFCSCAFSLYLVIDLSVLAVPPVHGAPGAGRHQLLSLHMWLSGENSPNIAHQIT